MEEDISLSVEDLKKGTAEFKRFMLMYNSALKEIETKVKILSDEFHTLYRYNPIEHIKTRIKSPESIIRKLEKKGVAITYQNMAKYLDDVAGIRIICSFLQDIYRIVDMFEKSSDLKIIQEKDYIKRPKPSGYSSYHLIVLVPVSFSSGDVNVKVEIQIRTIAQDFWASLEHKIKYKYENEVPKEISAELVECATMINQLDKKMSYLGNGTVDELTESMKKDNITHETDNLRMIEKLKKIMISSQNQTNGEPLN